MLGDWPYPTGSRLPWQKQPTTLGDWPYPRLSRIEDTAPRA
jgi:hypothetical protein